MSTEKMSADKFFSNFFVLPLDKGIKNIYIIHVTNKKEDNNMKAATISNKYPQLAKLSAWLEGCRPSVLERLNTLFTYGIVRPQQESGRGRFRRLNDFRREIEEALSACGVDVVKMNDAPRGGRTGDIWVLSGEWVGILENGETKYHAVGVNYNTIAISTYTLSKDVKDYIVASANKT